MCTLESMLAIHGAGLETESKSESESASESETESESESEFESRAHLEAVGAIGVPVESNGRFDRVAPGTFLL